MSEPQDTNEVAGGRSDSTAVLATAAPCEGCNGEGMVARFTIDGWDGDDCPFCHGTGIGGGSSN